MRVSGCSICDSAIYRLFVLLLSLVPAKGGSLIILCCDGLRWKSRIINCSLKYHIDSAFSTMALGSPLGRIHSFKLHPENVSCYIGIGQLINHSEGLKYSCNWIKELAKDVPSDTAKTDQLLKRIESGLVFNSDTMKALRSFSMLGSKYISKDSRPFPIKSLLCSPFQSFREKLSMLNSDYRNFKGTYKTLMTHDFRHDLHFDVPVLFVSGDEDYVCPNQLLMQCFDNIEAPVKKNAVIPKASHTCFFDQPEAFVRTITDFISN